MGQESSESTAHFVSRLRRQADFSGFGDTRNIQVRDQLIEGCLFLRLWLKLLERGNKLSLDVALHMASCYEAVTQQASEMQADVNKIDAKSATCNSKMAGWSRDTAHHRQPTKTEKERKFWKCRNEGHISKDEKSSVWKIMKAWMTKSLQLSSPLKTSRKWSLPSKVKKLTC